MIAHWDEIEPLHADKGPLGFDRYDLGTAAGTVNVGVTRAKVRPGKQSSPVHVEGDEEEIFYVLGGSGLLWQEGAVHDVRAGDCIVHRVAEQAHTLIGGPDGLDVIAFGERTDAPLTWLPRPRVVRMGISFQVPESPHPWDLEAAEGELELPEPSPRPPNVVNVDDIEPGVWEDRDMGGAVRPLAAAAGSVRTGLNHEVIPAGKLNTPPHCHSAEEEIFVVLDGEGTLLLGEEEHRVRRGHVVARPPGTGITHAFRSDGDGLTLLSYGTRVPSDMTYYARSGVVAFRGLRLAGKIERVSSDEIW